MDDLLLLFLDFNFFFDSVFLLSFWIVIKVLVEIKFLVVGIGKILGILFELCLEVDMCSLVGFLFILCWVVMVFLMELFLDLLCFFGWSLF